MRALAKLTWVETKLFLREPFSLIFAFAFPLVVLSVLASIFGTTADPEFGGVRPSDYYLAGYVGVVIGSIGLIAVPVHLAAYRERGVLRRFRATSVSPGAVLGAQLLVAFAMAMLASALLIVVGVLAYDAAAPTSAGGFVVAFVLGAASFLAVGLFLGMAVGSARAAQAVGLAAYFPMWLLSGAGPPPSVMGSTMRRISDALPLTYVVKSLQQPWLGKPLDGFDLAVLGVILVVAAGLAVWLFRRV